MMVFDRRKLGKKHRCECGCKFYDMGKEVPVCPRCGSVVDSGEALEEPETRLSVSEDSMSDVQDVKLIPEDEEEEDIKFISLSEVEKEDEDEEEFE